MQDLSKERRKRLDETLQLYDLHREIDDLLQWIADKEANFYLEIIKYKNILGSSYPLKGLTSNLMLNSAFSVRNSPRILKNFFP